MLKRCIHVAEQFLTDQDKRNAKRAQQLLQFVNSASHVHGIC